MLKINNHYLLVGLILFVFLLFIVFSLTGIYYFYLYENSPEIVNNNVSLLIVILLLTGIVGTFTIIHNEIDRIKWKKYKIKLRQDDILHQAMMIISGFDFKNDEKEPWQI